MADPTLHFTRDGLEDKCLSSPSPPAPWLLTRLGLESKGPWSRESCGASLSHAPKVRPTAREAWFPVSGSHSKYLKSFSPCLNWNHGGTKTVPRSVSPIRRRAYGDCKRPSSTHLADDPSTFDAAAVEGAQVLRVWITSKLKPIRGSKATCSYN